MISPVPRLFDRASVRRNRARAAGGFARHDFLFRHAALALADRLKDVTRDFSFGVEIGDRFGLVQKALQDQGKDLELMNIVADEESLPFASSSLDLIVSCLALHWVNDLPGCLAQIRRALKPGGLFLASLLGGTSLGALRQAFLEAESEVTGGASPRIAPMADIRDLGGLMQRAAFDQPVVDSEILTVSYETPLALLTDLRGMGEGNALSLRSRRPLRRDVLFRMAELYRERFSDPTGRVLAKFEILTLTGWGAEGG